MNSDFSSLGEGGRTEALATFADFAEAEVEADAGVGADCGTRDWIDTSVETAMATAAVMVD